MKQVQLHPTADVNNVDGLPLIKKQVRRKSGKRRSFNNWSEGNRVVDKNSSFGRGDSTEKKKKHEPRGKVIAFGLCSSCLQSPGNYDKMINNSTPGELRYPRSFNNWSEVKRGVDENSSFVRGEPTEKRRSMSQELKLSPQDTVGVVCKVR